MSYSASKYVLKLLNSNVPMPEPHSAIPVANARFFSNQYPIITIDGK
jgi:hypothetical protein